MRSLVNTFTDPTSLKQQLPVGAHYRPETNNGKNQTFRGQLMYNREWNGNHALAAVGGMDISQISLLNKSDDYYGYNEETLASNQNFGVGLIVPTLFNYSNNLPYLYSGFSSSQVRTVSTYANAAYTFRQRYTLSGSIRKDASSEFGMGSNKGGTPFYSTGVSWNIAKEPFYQFELLPRLQLRATFGYNGNTNAIVSAVAQIYYDNNPDENTGLPNARTNRASTTNRLLRPEKTGQLNLGLDFGFRNNRISGTFEYYNKSTTDLITETPVNPTTGFSELQINVAKLYGWGWDLSLNSVNLRTGKFSWNSGFLFSYNRVKVREVYSTSPNNAASYVEGGGSFNVGYDLSRLFAYRWAGLDPLTGDPRAYLDGKRVSISNTNEGNSNYNLLRNAEVTSSSIRFMGSSVPVYYGSLRNTFNYGNFTLSASLLYKLGYYFRRPIADLAYYSRLFSQQAVLGEEYAQRWQKPGDESITNVPSFTFPVYGPKDNFYQNSEINVLKGDHVRLQEINLSYGLGNKDWFLKNIRIYGNVSNLGVIWRANKLGLDPEVNDYPLARTYSLGLSANFN